jgi:proteasome assembly chaperone (PAC2) family protein
LDIVTVLERPPVLRRPVLLAAFQGWNDAGEAATGALDVLSRELRAQAFAEIDPEEFFDFQVTRPLVRMAEGGARALEWPVNRFSWAALPGTQRHVVLLSGTEPNLRWRTFTRGIINLAKQLGVETVVTLGALQVDVPHTRPVPVTGSASDESVAAALGLRRSRYEGPTGITGVFQDACAAADMPSLSLWAAVPHYVAQPPCPKATLALLGRLEDLLDIAVPVEDLVEDARAWERGVDEMASDDAEVADYVKQLEEQRDTSELPEASGDAIAREFERYLKRRQREGEL